jgi:acetylglutamate kinase
VGRAVKDSIQKARTLVEALPYIRAFHDKLVVIKYGGAAMSDDSLKASFATDVTLLRFIGMRPVIVHGGGPQIARMLKRLGKESRFVDGMRVTDDETMEIVEMVLGGTVNAEIVDLIGRSGGRAVGLTGKDGAFMRVTRMLGPNGEDLGRVGEPEYVDPDILLRMTQAGFIPVIAPIGTDSQGATYNINADLAAARIAEALPSEKLVLLTDVEGVLDQAGELISKLDRFRARKAIEDGTIEGGMIPKVECCIRARERGVTSTHIIDGRIPHALLLEIFTDGGVGTQIAGAA